VRIAGETLLNYVQRDPSAALSDYLAIKAAHDALYDCLKCHVADHGPLKGKGSGSMRKIKKNLKTLNSKRAWKILEEAGLDVLSLANLKISEESIKQELGVKKGNELLKTLREAGCYDERTIEYYGIKA
jgi:hypothetical protein